MDARTTALTALIACRRQNAWPDAVLKDYIRRDGLDRRDAALTTRLCYGVQQNRLLLDYFLSQFVRTPLKKLQPVVLDILRLALYQILFLDRVPDSAVVNEAVNMARKQAGQKAAGLVNGVLRNMLRSRDSLVMPEDLSIRYSHPPELVALLRENVGEENLESLLQADNEAPQTVIQLNSLRASAQQLTQSLTAAGAVCRPRPEVPGCYTLTGAGSLEALDAWTQGWFYVQDAAARMAVQAMELQPGMRVLDTCAAPGGKSFAAAIAMQNCGEILSCDLHPHKIRLIESGRDRLGLSCIHTLVRDASKADPAPAADFDAVLVDVPCSGLGVIRKKPDIRYKNLQEMEKLPALQLQILSTSAACVRPGGRLLYATCTVLQRENELVVAQFLQKNPDFYEERLPLPAENSGHLTLLPGRDGTDGFFICRLRRRA